MQPFKLVYLPFPEECRGKVRGMTSYHDDYSLILIDSSLPEGQQAATLRHELSHIALHHFTDDRDIRQIEEEADVYAKKMTEPEFNKLMQWRIANKKGASEQ